MNTGQTAPPQEWRTSTRFVWPLPQQQQLVASENQQPTTAALQVSPQWIETAPIRKEYREQLETDVFPLRAEALASAESAAAFAESTVRAGILLNGGGLIAIPAIVALFRLDVTRLFGILLVTGGIFIAGLVTTWVASVCAFFAYANKSDTAYAASIRRGNMLNAMFYPALFLEMDAAARKAGELETAYRGNFVRFRKAAIILCFVGLTAFVVGVSIGSIAILKLRPEAAAHHPALGMAMLQGAS